MGGYGLRLFGREVERIVLTLLRPLAQLDRARRRGERIEHYEIAAYGTDVALAKALGEAEVAALLSRTLEEEKQTDLKLTEVAERHLMAAALAGEDNEARPAAGPKAGGGTKRGSA